MDKQLETKGLACKKPTQNENRNKTELEKQTEITWFYAVCSKAIVNGLVLVTWQLRLWLPVFYMHILYTYNRVCVYKLFYFSCSKQENIVMHLLPIVFTILGLYSVQGLLERDGSICYPSGKGLTSRKVIGAWQWRWPPTSQSYTQAEGVTPEPDSTLVL